MADKPRPKTGLGEAVVAHGTRENLWLPRVAGMQSDLDDIKLNGHRLQAVLGGAVVGDPTISRTISGASSVTVDVEDPDRLLLNSDVLASRARMQIDHLGFQLAGVGKSGDILTLTFEDADVALLRLMTGYVKAYRAEVTRAEFLHSLIREANRKRDAGIKWVSPHEHEIQPIKAIKTDRADRAAATQDAGNLSGGGFTNEGALTVKGVKPNPEQMNVATTALRVCDSVNAPQPPRVALFVALIQESNMENYPNSEALDGSTSSGVLSFLASTAASLGVDARDVAAVCHCFLVEGIHENVGAIKHMAANPDVSPAEEAQLQEWSAYPGLYAQWTDEARRWVESWNGQGTSSAAGESVTEVKPYVFERKKDENTWSASGRLAAEVRWRRFMLAGRYFFMAEDDLFNQVPRIRVSEDSPGVEAIDFDYDVGKPVTELTMTVRTKDWAIPPGTTVAVWDEGVAGGKYLVSKIEKSIASEFATATLRKPVEPLPEPAPETTTRTVSGGGGGGSSAGSGGAADMVKWAKSVLGTKEGSALQRKWAAAAGVSASVPWCSVFVSYGLVQILGLPAPSNPAYSGTWLDWGGGSRVGKGSIQPGDLLIFDWGDGGITDHVALAIGGGQMIGGNDSNNSVGQSSIPTGNIVGVVRPHYA